MQEEGKAFDTWVVKFNKDNSNKEIKQQFKELDRELRIKIINSYISEINAQNQEQKNTTKKLVEENEQKDSVLWQSFANSFSELQHRVQTFNDNRQAGSQRKTIQIPFFLFHSLRILYQNEACPWMTYSKKFLHVHDIFRSFLSRLLEEDWDKFRHKQDIKSNMQLIFHVLRYYWNFTQEIYPIATTLKTWLATTRTHNPIQ